tara:strand:+ start:505 stop:729 length:225 start_codon:yes stop_codon:yes gene_type:complete
MLDQYSRLFFFFRTLGKLLNNNLKEFSEKILEILVDFLLNIESIDLISAPKLEFKITCFGELDGIFGSKIESIG